MKIKFREVRLSSQNKERLNTINRIIREYQAQGYILTLRQLYYQLVSRDIIPNKQAEYSKLSTLLKEGRMGGIVDWDAIEDRLRKPQTANGWSSPAEILNAVVDQFQLKRMEGQPNYVEVWVEKDALSGVLKRVTEKYHIPILVNRGYSSASAMYDSYNRFKDAIEAGQKVTILYLGDYDPSGIDMIRDVEDRILEFFAGSEEITALFDALHYDDKDEYKHNLDYGYDSDKEEEWEYEEREMKRLWCKDQFTVKPIALTRKQIDLYDPPENPAKKTDPRSKKFISELGSSSWEVDALKPEVLNEILTGNIEYLINQDILDEILEAEAGHIAKLAEFRDSFNTN